MVSVNHRQKDGKFSISWGNALVRVDYFGDIENQDIEKAHFSLNGNGRFYDCDKLILNLIECDLSKVVVSELMPVIATDLGAAESIQKMKVAMIATKPVNVKRVTDYIESSKVSPWEFKLFCTIGGAEQWLNS